MNTNIKKSVLKVFAFIYLLCPASAWSQSFEILTEVVGNGKPIKLDDGSWHALDNNSVAKYTITFEKGERDVTEIKVNYNGITEEIPISECKKEILIPLESGKDQTVSFTVSYTWQEPRMVDEVDSVGNKIGEHQEGFISHEESLPAIVSAPISIYSLPVYGDIVPPSQYRYMLVGKTTNWSVADPSGSNNSWKYKWSIDGKTDDVPTFSYTPETAGDKKIALTVQNIAPDGNTVWDEKEYDSYDITVYEIPSYSYTPQNPKTVFYKQTDNLEFEVKPQGGYSDGFKYKWNDNPETKDAKHGLGTQTTDGKIMLDVVNYDPDGNELWRSGSKPLYEYKVFPEFVITPSMLKTDTINILNGDKKDLSVSVPEKWPSGGVWTYEWRDNYEGIDHKLDKNTNLLTYSAVNANEEGFVPHTVNAVVTFSYNGEKWDEWSFPFSLNVYATPTVVFNVKTVFSTTTPDGDKETQGEDIKYNPTKPGDSKIDRDLLSGDTFIVEAKTPSDLGTWTYFLDEQKQESQIINIPLKNDSNQPLPDPHIIYAKFNQKGLSFTASLLCEISIYPVPSWVSNIISSDETTIETYCGNDSIIFTDGGSLDGWTYEWKASDGIAAFDSINVQGEYNVKVTAKNIVGGYTRFDDTKNFVLHIYGEPQIESVSIKNNTARNVDKEQLLPLPLDNPLPDGVLCYKNDELLLDVKIKGGNPDTWSYSLNEKKEAVSGESIEESIETSKTGKSSYTLVIQNALDGTNNLIPANEMPPFSYSFDLKVYDNPKIDKEEPGFTDYSNGQKIRLVATPNNTYNEGWSYWWTDESGAIIPELDKPEFTSTASNTTSNEIKHTYTLHATNILPDGNVGYNDVLKYKTISVWPTPSVNADFRFINVGNDNASGLNQKNNKVRGGNTLGLVVNSATGGYCPEPDSWKYVWNNGTSSVTKYSAARYEDHLQNTQSVVLRAISLDDAKAVYKSSYSLDIKNDTPEGFEKNGVYEAQNQKTIYIYRRPVTPSKLVTKGNGTSKTVNVLFEESESSQKLMSKDYYLVFGYRDASGYHDVLTKKQDTDGNLRYAVLDAAVFNQPNLYVYSMWMYGNDKVTSGLRYRASTTTLPSDVDENWDGSVFTDETPVMITGTRAVVTEDVNAIDDVEAVDAAPIAYYGIDGKQNRTPQRGLNIVKMSDGTVKKILVK